MSIRKLKTVYLLLAALLVAMVFVLGEPFVVEAADNQPVQPSVLTIQVEGMITAGTSSYIRRAVSEAEEQGYQALVILINTPGGLVTATLDIITDLLNANVPIITFVAPRGAIAASAGSFVLLTGHVAVMAPGTTCGAAMPVQIDPEGGATQAADDKTIQFLAGHMRSLAETRGRPIDLAEKIVTESLTLDAKEAIDQNLVDLIAPDLPTLLKQIDGRQVTVQDKPIHLQTAEAVIVPLEMNWVEKATRLLSNPQLAYILLLLGVFGLIIGFGAPETYAPEVLGVISLALGLFGIGLFEVNLFAIILIVLGIGLLVAEVLTPTFGVLTASGLACLILGTMFFTAEPLLPRGWLIQFRFMAIGIGTAGGLFMVIAMRAILRLRKRKALQGASEFNGRSAQVIERLDPEGQILIAGEIWRAVSENGGSIETGQIVQVTGRQGLLIKVKPISKEE